MTLAVTGTDNALILDQVLSQFNVGRHLALWEMNVPGSIQLQLRADDKIRRRLPKAEEINFDDALIDIVYLTDNGVPRYGSNRDVIKCEGGETLSNPNAHYVEASAMAAKTGMTFGKKVTHLYVPKARYEHLIKGSWDLDAKDCTTKLFVSLSDGFYFLRGFFSPERTKRCVNSKFESN